MAKFAYCRCRTLFYCLIYGCKDSAFAMTTQQKPAKSYRICFIYKIYK